MNVRNGHVIKRADGLRGKSFLVRSVVTMAHGHRKKFGARSFGMLVCAYIWTLFAVGAFREVPLARAGAFHLMWSSDLRGWLWLIPAALALLTAWSRRLSYIAIAALFVPAGTTMASFGMSWVLHEIPGGSPGYVNGWYSASFYLAAMFIPVIVATIPSPPVAQVNLEAVSR